MVTVAGISATPEYADAFSRRKASIDAARAAMAARHAPRAPVDPSVTNAIIDQQLGQTLNGMPASTDGMTPAALLNAPQGVEVAPRETGFFENLMNSGERAAIGAITDPDARMAALTRRYGAENVSRHGDDNFMIAEPEGGYRLYNPEGIDAGDFASILPEVGGTIGSILGAVGGGTAGTVVAPGAGTIGGAIVGGGLGNVAGKNFTSQLISSLAGDDNPISMGDVAWDFTEGAAGEALGPLLRAAKPTAKSLMGMARDPVGDLIRRSSVDDAMTNAATDVLGGNSYNDLTENSARYVLDAARGGADPTLTQIAGKVGRGYMEGAAGMNRKVASNVKDFVTGLSDDAERFLANDAGIGTGINKVSALDRVSSDMADNAAALKSGRTSVYTVDGDELFDPSRVRSTIVDAIQSKPDFMGSAMGSPGLAGAIVDPAGVFRTSVQSADNGAPLLRPLNSSLSFTDDELARYGLSREAMDYVDQIVRSTTPETVASHVAGTSTSARGAANRALATDMMSPMDGMSVQQALDIYRPNAFGNVPHALRDVHEALRSDFKESIPGFGDMEAAARPFSELLSSQADRATGVFDASKDRIGKGFAGVDNIIAKGEGKPDEWSAMAIARAIDQGALSPEQASAVANDMFGAVSAKNFSNGKLPGNVSNSLAALADEPELFNKLFTINGNGEAVLSGLGGNAQDVITDILNGRQLTGAGAERAKKIALALEGSERAKGLVDDFGNIQPTKWLELAPIIAAVSGNALGAAGMFGITRTMPGKVAKEMMSNDAARGVVRLGERSAARKRALDSARSSRMSRVPVLREFDPAYRGAIAQENQKWSDLGASFAGDFPTMANPFEGALFEAPGMGVGAMSNPMRSWRDVDAIRKNMPEYLQGIRKEWKTEVPSRLGVEALDQYVTEKERTRGAFD